MPIARIEKYETEPKQYLGENSPRIEYGVRGWAGHDQRSPMLHQTYPTARARDERADAFLAAVQ